MPEARAPVQPSAQAVRPGAAALALAASAALILAPPPSSAAAVGSVIRNDPLALLSSSLREVENAFIRPLTEEDRAKFVDASIEAGLASLGAQHHFLAVDESRALGACAHCCGSLRRYIQIRLSLGQCESADRVLHDSCEPWCNWRAGPT